MTDPSTATGKATSTAKRKAAASRQAKRPAARTTVAPAKRPATTKRAVPKKAAPARPATRSRAPQPVPAVAVTRSVTSPALATTIEVQSSTALPETRSGRGLRVRVKNLPEKPPALRLPVLPFGLPLPSRDQMPFIAGVCLVAALEVIDWPLAAVVIVGHTLITRSRNDAIRALAEGIEAVV